MTGATFRRMVGEAWQKRRVIGAPPDGAVVERLDRFKRRQRQADLQARVQAAEDHLRRDLLRSPVGGSHSLMASCPPECVAAAARAAFFDDLDDDDRQVEHAFTAFFDGAGSAVGFMTATRGRSDTVDFIPHRLVAEGRRLGARQAVCVHSHPGGPSTLSPADHDAASTLYNSLHRAGIRLRQFIAIDDDGLDYHDLGGDR